MDTHINPKNHGHVRDMWFVAESPWKQNLAEIQLLKSNRLLATPCISYAWWPRKIHTNGNAGLKYYNMIIVQNKNFYLRGAITAVLFIWCVLENVFDFKPIKKFPKALLYYLPGNKYSFKCVFKTKTDLFYPFSFPDHLKPVVTLICQNKFYHKI